MSGGQIREADGRGPPRPPPCYDGSNANVAANSLLDGGEGGARHDNAERGLFRVEGGGDGEIEVDGDDGGDDTVAMCTCRKTWNMVCIPLGNLDEVFPTSNKSEA